MNTSTEDDLLSLVVSLNVLSSEDGLTAEEKDAIYNLYGHTIGVVAELLNTPDDEEYDPEKLV